MAAHRHTKIGTVNTPLQPGRFIAPMAPASQASEADGDDFRILTRALVRLAAAAGSVMLLTETLRRTTPHWHLAHLAMFYLLVVQATAVLAGHGPAVLTAT